MADDINPCVKTWMTHLVVVAVGVDGVLHGQCYTAEGDDHHDEEVKVAQVDNVMTESPNTEGKLDRDDR